MTAEQDAIAALAARIDAAEARIAAKLTAPAPDPVDLSPLTAVADKLDALVPAEAPAPAPVDVPAAPAPVDVPVALPPGPVAVDTSAADSTPGPFTVPDGGPAPLPSVPLA